MKSNLPIAEITLSIISIALAILLLNPFDIWMPTVMVMATVAVLVGAFALFAGLIWREGANDEREAAHRMRAGRLAYLSGAAVLILGIIVESFMHTVDVWLVLALTSMILFKLFGHIYSRKYY